MLLPRGPLHACECLPHALVARLEIGIRVAPRALHDAIMHEGAVATADGFERASEQLVHIGAREVQAGSIDAAMEHGAQQWNGFGRSIECEQTLRHLII